LTTIQRLSGDKTNTVLASVVFLVTLAVYTATMTPTVPFWDSGEFIATSAILGVPHPPGTPLFVLLGRVFTLLPFGSPAQMVNWLSALSSAITILFTYLITVKIARYVLRGEERRGLPVYTAGVVAAFMAAFATTFWDNAIEAEVYAAACAIMTFCVWLILRWYENDEGGNRDGLLLVITYIVGLGVGIHLGVAIAAWAAVAFVFACRPEYLRRWNYIGWALVTWLSLGLGVQSFSFLVAPAVLLLTLGIYLLTGKLHKLALWSSILFMFGISVHLYLLIRAGLDPAINEGKPADWHALWLFLIRDQYKPPSPLHRRTSLFFQIDHMWLRYMWWNFMLYGSRLTAALPVALAAIGAWVHVARDRKTAVILAVLFIFLGPAMVFYLNFSNHEVRERDYFFVQNFQFMAVWVGIGAAVVLAALAGVRRTSSRRVLELTGSLLLVGMSLLPLAENWWTHDRSRYVIARTYASNLLSGLDPDAILFTNGDNDTFPLWYMQEVEGLRKDVRVVNLSLLNTPWYMRQLRDLEPKVPTSWTDAQINSVGEAMQFIFARAQQQPSPYEGIVRSAWDNAGLQQIVEFMSDMARRENRGVIIKDVAVDNILKANGGRRPVYMAVSVPDHIGLDARMRMEGLVFRIYEEPVKERVDTARLKKDLHEVFSYAGFVRPDPKAPAGSIGVYDDSFFKGTGPSRMCMNNHAAAFTRLALELSREPGNEDEALVEMENAEAIAPGFPGVVTAKGYLLETTGRLDEADTLYRASLERDPGNWQYASRLGAVLLQLKRPEEAVAFFDRAAGLAPDQYEPYQGLFTAYYDLGRSADALASLERWLTRHPEDRRVRQLVDQMQGSLDAPGTPEDSTSAPSGSN